VATREQVIALLDSGHSYAAAARALNIAPGQAYMIATGMPADGSAASPPDDPTGAELLSGSSQELVNSSVVNPLRDPLVEDWVRERAARDNKQNA
jgi:hypothetical protein